MDEKGSNYGFIGDNYRILQLALVGASKVFENVDTGRSSLDD